MQMLHTPHDRTELMSYRPSWDWPSECAPDSGITPTSTQNFICGSSNEQSNLDRNYRDMHGASLCFTQGHFSRA